MSGIEVNLRNIFQDDRKAVVVEVCKSLFGVNFENSSSILAKLESDLPDAIICSHGFLRQNHDFFTKHESPALIIRGDWSNYKLDESTPYPAQLFRHVEITNPKEASRLGASAFMCDLFLGTSDMDNVVDIRRLQKFVNEGHEIGLPIIANVEIFGPRVNESNISDVIGLGVRTCSEIGIKVISFPLISTKSVQQIIQGIPKTDILLKVRSSNKVSTFSKLLKQIPNRYKGIILDGYDNNFNWENIGTLVH